jgi:hypothetical protein
MIQQAFQSLSLRESSPSHRQLNSRMVHFVCKYIFTSLASISTTSTSPVLLQDVLSRFVPNDPTLAYIVNEFPQTSQHPAIFSIHRQPPLLDYAILILLHSGLPCTTILSRPNERYWRFCVHHRRHRIFDYFLCTTFCTKSISGVTP